MKIIAVIPARYASTRFPGKPLVDIFGISMIEHVYNNVSEASTIDEVWVATDDRRIEDKVLSFGGKVLMTSSEHKTGSDRIVEALEQLDSDVIVNVQGDEPLIRPDVIEQLIAPFLQNAELQMATLKTKIFDKEDIEDPNIVKVVTDNNGMALYFSRSPIPYNRDNSNVQYYKHIGVYAYRSSFLRNFINMKQSSLEIAESLEQLRVLESGVPIQVIETKHQLISVDTPEDLHKLEGYLNRLKPVIR